MDTAAKFQVVSLSTDPRSGHENSERETKAHREARAKVEFSKPKSIVFVGRLAEASLKMLAKDGDLAISPMANKLYFADKAGKCLICHGTHGASTANLTTWYQKVDSKEIFALSNTCRTDYLQVQGIEKVLVNPELYRSIFPKGKTR